jgi:hypothetical protein
MNGPNETADGNHSSAARHNRNVTVVTVANLLKD